MQNQNIVNKADKNKVYFLVVVITALLGINLYLYFKNKQDDKKIVNVSTVKDKLSLELEKIEVELDKVNSLNIALSDKLQNEQKLARLKIIELKIALNKGVVTQGDLNDAQKQIKNLREFVKNYNDQVVMMERENSFLKSERDSLKTTVNIFTAKTNSLARENHNLSKKVKLGAALKTSSIAVEAFRVKDNGKNYITKKANAANKFIVSFSIASNSLAPKNFHKIYLRVFDPAGNLIANDNNMFKADGQKMQYSSVIEVSYNNGNTIYNMDWVNPAAFMEGTYTLMLYTDGAAMGKSTIELD
jgi:hypothetical protein